jgi:hypothetical protein
MKSHVPENPEYKPPRRRNNSLFLSEGACIQIKIQKIKKIKFLQKIFLDFIGGACIWDIRVYINYFHKKN